MTKFESSTKTVKVARKPVYGFLADIRNFGSLIPEGKVRNFEAEIDNCRFTIDGLGEVGVRKLTARPDDTIMFESEGSTPFRFDLSIDLEESGDEDTKLKLTLRADLNMMMKMMASKPLEEGLEMVASELADHLNNRQWI